MLVQIRGKAAARWPDRMTHRTRAADLIPRGIAGDEAEQGDDVSLDLIDTPRVLLRRPSRLHPRIALTDPGDARVKAGGAVPLAEPELSLVRPRIPRDSRKGEPVSVPARPETRATDHHKHININVKLTNKRENEWGNAFASGMSCRPATDQCLPKVNQTIREFRLPRR